MSMQKAYNTKKQPEYRRTPKIFILNSTYIQGHHATLNTFLTPVS